MMEAVKKDYYPYFIYRPYSIVYNLGYWGMLVGRV